MKIEIGSDARGPLTGIRVLDLSAVVSGPLCGQILGDLGADVIKVEPPAGDSSRRLGLPATDGISPLFAQCNRNKRSIAIDLKTPEGRQLVGRMAREVDVLLLNYRPGVAERLGLGYDDLISDNPKLVYVSITGFGPDGPYRDHPAYDTVIQGLTGFLPIQGDDGPPCLVRSVMADKSTALTATYAVLAALYERDRVTRTDEREGQHVEVPMLDAYAAFSMPDILGDKTFPEYDGPSIPNPHRTWQTADGFVVMMPIEDHQFAGICRAIDREDLISDPRCANLLLRIIHLEEIFGAVADEIRKLPTAELVARAREFGAPIAPVNEIDDFLADPQVAHNQTILESDDDPALGRVRYVRPPVRFLSSPASFRRMPPRLGEQTDEILGQMGHSKSEIARLREAGTVS